MRIQQIRNATLRLTYGGATFLTDPWLCPKGAMGTFSATPFRPADPAMEEIPMPRCDLPMAVAEVLKDVDAYVVTHVHPDHIDMEPDGTVGRPLSKDVPVFVQSEEDARIFLASQFHDVTVLYENSAFGDIALVKTPGRHGTKIPCGPSCGVVFSSAGEKTLYIAGDTIWYDGVREVLARFSPEIIVVNACAAALLYEGRLIMDCEDVARVHEALPTARIVISHMDTVAHATISRRDMRAYLSTHGLEQVCLMPEDGEVLSL